MPSTHAYLLNNCPPSTEVNKSHKLIQIKYWFLKAKGKPENPEKARPQSREPTNSTRI